MEPLKILGVDPSSSCTGLCILEVDPTTHELLSVITEPAYPARDHKHNWMANGTNISGPLFMDYRIRLVVASIKRFIDKHQPHIVYSEVPHITSQHLNNVFGLGRLKTAIEVLIRECAIPHYQMAATSAKAVIGANATKGRKQMNAKERVLDSMLMNDTITGMCNVSDVTEDERDAILLAFAGHFGEKVLLVKVL